jgi:cardiolipin synthase
VQATLEQIIRDECIQVTEASYATKNNIFQRMVQAIAFEVVRFIVYIFTFYVKQR